MNCSLPGSSVYGSSSAGMLAWVAISISKGSSQPRNQTQVSCISCICKRTLYCCTTGEAPNPRMECLKKKKKIKIQCDTYMQEMRSGKKKKKRKTQRKNKGINKERMRTKIVRWSRDQRKESFTKRVVNDCKECR